VLSVSPAEIKEVGWLLMLIPFGVVLGIGLFFVSCARRRASQGRSLQSSGPAQLTDSSAIAASYRSFPFDQPNRWLAVKASQSSVVQAALNLHRPTPCSWEEGLAEAREDKVFISPPISGWVLVVGPGLPEPAEDVDACYRFLTGLSRKLGHLQFFSVSRVLNYHCWALLERGQVFRAYAWAGETVWNQGPVTAAEKELQMLCLSYCGEETPFALREALAANSEKVNLLAARWSVDPAALSPSLWTGRGIVGEFSHSKSH
jgi:hypothetical protein